jgi:hypothetical protein
MGVKTKRDASGDTYEYTLSYIDEDGNEIEVLNGDGFETREDLFFFISELKKCFAVHDLSGGEYQKFSE